MKTQTFKTLVFKEGEGKGAWAEFFEDEVQRILIPSICPVLMPHNATIKDFYELYPDIDFSQVELIEIEVTVK